MSQAQPGGTATARRARPQEARAAPKWSTPTAAGARATEARPRSILGYVSEPRPGACRTAEEEARRPHKLRHDTPPRRSTPAHGFGARPQAFEAHRHEDQRHASTDLGHDLGSGARPC